MSNIESVAHNHEQLDQIFHLSTSGSKVRQAVNDSFAPKKSDVNLHSEGSHHYQTSMCQEGHVIKHDMRYERRETRYEK